MGCANCKLVYKQIFPAKEVNKQSEQDNYVKILILGSSEVGKSTIAKQFKILYQNGFSEQERICYKPVIYRNLLCSMLRIIHAMKNLGIHYGNPDRVEDAKIITEDAQ